MIVATLVSLALLALLVSAGVKTWGRRHPKPVLLLFDKDKAEQMRQLGIAEGEPFDLGDGRLLVWRRSFQALNRRERRSVMSLARRRKRRA